jgi:hypothetical protein
MQTTSTPRPRAIPTRREWKKLRRMERARRTGNPTPEDLDLQAEPVHWSEDDIVQLHWRLLQEVRQLANPATPLEEKLDTLRWMFTEPEKDALPFSFANCVRVVGCSPLSPIAYCGLVDADEIRRYVRHSVAKWLAQTVARYPDWVRRAVAANPVWVEDQLARNPQWINEQVRQGNVQPDLFL